MNKEHYQQAINDNKYKKLGKFILSLTTKGKLTREYIDTNDWENNTRPSVYVHNKNNMFKIKRYSRCSSYDVKNAIKFYNQ